MRDRRAHQADAAATTGPSTTPHAPADQLAKLQAEAKEAQDRYLRTLAEVENTKKRLQREKDEFAKFAVESVVRSLLPILDSLSQALVAVDQQSDPPAPAQALGGPGAAVIKGVHLIYRELLGLLEKEGVARIPTIGERFDPHVHEAVAEVAAQGGQADGTIIEEVHGGYTMHGKVVRPAMVKVAKKAADSTQHTANSKESREPRSSS